MGRHLASRCPLCGKEEESLDDMLLHCPKVYNQRLSFLRFLGFIGYSQNPYRMLWQDEKVHHPENP